MKKLRSNNDSIKIKRLIEPNKTSYEYHESLNRKLLRKICIVSKIVNIYLLLVFLSVTLDV